MGQRVLQIVGDGLKGNWITWRWSDGADPVGVARVRRVTRETARLKRALPAGAHRLGFDGELADPHGEQELMRALTEVLLPAELRAQIAAVVRTGERLHIRVAPTPRAAAVPWGLLFLDADRRLLDVADVSWIGPLLPRDLASPIAGQEADHLTDAGTEGFPMVGGSAPGTVGAVPASNVADKAVHTGHTCIGHEPLYVIDPVQPLGHVLRAADCAKLADRASGRVSSGAKFNADAFSAALRNGVSRLVLVGHTHGRKGASTTGFLFSDGTRVLPLPLTAERLIAEPEHWPMPTRVAVVACASGSDMADHEPFGLSAALLHNGADTVHATLWVLPTDQAFRGAGVTDSGLLPLALALDDAQQADDPVAAVCAWQRAQLDRWRADPSLATSPLIWGAAMTMTAPSSRRLDQAACS